LPADERSREEQMEPMKAFARRADGTDESACGTDERLREEQMEPMMINRNDK
jgi:hypothetical protein